MRHLGRTQRLEMAHPSRRIGGDAIEQTEELLTEFGFGADEVAQLRQAKVV